MTFRQLLLHRRLSHFTILFASSFISDIFVTMESNRLVVQKYFERGLSSAQIFRHVKQIGITRDCVYWTIHRLRDTGSVQDRPRSGRPRTCRIKERIKRVREKIRRNSQRSARKLALEEGTDDRSMRRVLHIDLGLKTYKKHKSHGLSAK